MPDLIRYPAVLPDEELRDRFVKIPHLVRDGQFLERLKVDWAHFVNV